MGNRERKEALRSFVVERRAQLRPEDVGLPRLGRRRVEGLRREEVASLVGVSVAWYTQFETGAIRVSPRMLDLVAKVLKLSDDERLYLFSLAIDEMPTIAIASLIFSRPELTWLSHSGWSGCPSSSSRETKVS